MTSGLEQPDLDLFKKVKSRDKEAFGTFVREYQQRVFNFCYSYLYDADKAKDNTQETFLRLYRSAHKIRDLKKFEGYMFRIARNLCMDQIRNNKRHKVVSHLPREDGRGKTIHDYVRPTENTPESILLAREEGRQQKRLHALVNEKMKELTPEQRAAIDLVHFKKLPYKKTCEILECAEGTIKSRINRGIIRLGELLKSHINQAKEYVDEM